MCPVCLWYLQCIGTDCHWEAKGSREGGRNTEENCAIWGREERSGEQDPDGAETDGERQFQEAAAHWQWNVPCTRESTGRCKLLQACDWHYHILLHFFLLMHHIFLCFVLTTAFDLGSAGSWRKQRLTGSNLHLHILSWGSSNQLPITQRFSLVKRYQLRLPRSFCVCFLKPCAELWTAFLCRFQTWSWIKGCLRTTLRMFRGRTIPNYRVSFPWIRSDTG